MPARKMATVGKIGLPKLILLFLAMMGVPRSPVWHRTDSKLSMWVLSGA